VNSLAGESKEFQWSIVYKWYFELSPDDKIKNKVWNSGIANVCFIPEGTSGMVCSKI
jgi:hypothetical protein